jgi:hypothetical protein
MNEDIPYLGALRSSLLRSIGKRHARSLRARRLPGRLGLLSVAAAGLVLVFLVTGLGERHDATRLGGARDIPRTAHNSSFLLDPRVDTKDLLLGGQQVSLAEAEKESDFALYRPNSPMAADKSLSEVWIGGAGDRAVAFRYETGVTIYLTPWPEGKDVAKSYESRVADTGAGSVQMISGNTAWVIPKDSQAEGMPPDTVINMVVNGVELSIHGDLPTDDMLSIASSVSTEA